MPRFAVQCVIVTLVFELLFPAIIFSQDAREIVKRADTKYNGEKSSYSEMSMTIVRPKYKRSIEFKGWAVTGKDALHITLPQRRKGNHFSRAETIFGAGIRQFKV